MELSNITGLHGSITVPGDKSISHRAVMFGSIAEGTTEITHFLRGADCLATIGCFRDMGIDIEEKPDCILVHGKGLHGLQAPSNVLNVGNSGTTTRRDPVRPELFFAAVRRCFLKFPPYETDPDPAFFHGRQYFQHKGQ